MPPYCFLLMSFDLSRLDTTDLVGIIDLIHSGAISSSEVYEYFLQKTHTLNPQLNAFIEVYDSQRVADPQASLAGVPIGVKDVFNEQ